MRISEAKKLHRGDEVLWNDPDGGACSRVYKIQHIEWFSDCCVRIMDEDGSTLEAFARELSFQQGQRPANQENKGHARRLRRDLFTGRQ